MSRIPNLTALSSFGRTEYRYRNPLPLKTNNVQTESEPKHRWDAGAAVLVLIGAELKCATLAYRFAIDVAATWLDAAHTVTTSWN